MREELIPFIGGNLLWPLVHCSACFSRDYSKFILRGHLFCAVADYPLGTVGMYGGPTRAPFHTAVQLATVPNN